jgi:predicted nucleotidyltransferase
MDNREVISKLREHRDELTAAGIVHLRVFGSVAEEKRTIRPMSI